MMIHEITPKAGKHKRRKRIGRGIGSGHGKTAGRGTKGAGSRSGWTGSIRPSREGGQMPLFRRVAKRGFSNFNFRTEYLVVNVSDLEAHFDAGAQVTPEALVKAGLIRSTKLPVKVLGQGELSKRLEVTAAGFSQAAMDKITQAGGAAHATGVKPRPGEGLADANANA